MKPINIYALTRIKDSEQLKRLERQLSGRRYYLTIKEWETDGLEKLLAHLPGAEAFRFYYSFQIPKLGKEFDLLRISEDKVINIELKSSPVEDDRIKKQLSQNRYYLATLGKTMRSYTYISSQDRLVRLTNSGNIVESTWENLYEDLVAQTNLYEGDAEELFREENYIISPLDDPERFLNEEYFLTSQQKDIERKILKAISTDNQLFQCFTGLPGTGKTLLLYNIAMRLSTKQKICVYHCGPFSKELRQLDERLKRIDFLDGQNSEDTTDLSAYTAILVDESHRINDKVLDKVLSTSEQNNIPVVFCYDSELAISEYELPIDIIRRIEEICGLYCYRLTNRIRTNSELSAFIQCLMQGSCYNHRKEYPAVSVVYGNNLTETKQLLEGFIKDGYMYIYDDKQVVAENDKSINIDVLSRQEYEKVVMIMDNKYYYDEMNLRSTVTAASYHPVRNLFHGLNRAKERLAIVVMENTEVFDIILKILQK